MNNKYNSSDNKVITITYQEGSVATIHYYAVGSREYPKENMEVHFDGKSIVLDDYNSLKGYGVNLNEINKNTSRKGHFEELERLYETLKGRNTNWPIELWDMVETTEATFMITKL
ncbi:hypothetical protein EHM76_05550 [bacterium]|nr:MAG: hypothetical protein EHM76_05550 [bacterium]